MKLWDYLLNRNLSMYIRAIKHPKAALNYYKEYSNEFRLRNKKIISLFNVSEKHVNDILDKLSSDGFYENIKKKLDHYKNMNLGTTLNPISAPTLYLITRILRPKILVETGVSSGVSTAFILKGLSDNKNGKLYSIDLPNSDPDGVIIPKGKPPGWVVPDELRDKHELIIGDSKVELPKLLEKLKTIDWFFHDSLHTYEFMSWEYEQAWAHIRKEGILLSDDITWNAAFSDFVEKVGAKKWAGFYSLGAIIKS